MSETNPNNDEEISLEDKIVEINDITPGDRGILKSLESASDNLAGEKAGGAIRNIRPDTKKLSDLMKEKKVRSELKEMLGNFK